MIKTLKWVYKLGYDKGLNKATAVLERASDFEWTQEQIKNSLKDPSHKVTPEDHRQRARAIEDALTAIDPEKYPNIDRFMELFS